MDSQGKTNQIIRPRTVDLVIPESHRPYWIRLLVLLKKCQRLGLNPEERKRVLQETVVRIGKKLIDAPRWMSDVNEFYEDNERFLRKHPELRTDKGKKAYDDMLELGKRQRDKQNPTVAREAIASVAHDIAMTSREEE